VRLADLQEQPASEAAIALRRAGLRPALERTFHWGEATHGLVVAQEPAAGSDVPLDSPVLLFVSAPGGGGDQPTAVAPADSAQLAHPACSSEDVRDEPPSVTDGLRRRKRGLSPYGPAAVSTAGEQETDQIDPQAGWYPSEPDVAEFTRSERAPAGDGLAPAACVDESLAELAPARLATDDDRRDALYIRVPRRVVVPLWTVVATAAVMVTLAVVALAGQTHALQAAGAFNGTPIGGVQAFVDKLRGNLVWLGGTAMGLVIAVVGIMFMAGHSRAHDLAIRTIAGLAVLASISGIVA
jgi:hypothetical protein